MSKPPSKPDPWKLGEVRVRCIGGPDPAAPKRWRWRAEVYADGKSSTVWSGWGTRKELDRTDSPILAAYTGGAWRKAARTPAPVLLLGDLLGEWIAAVDARADIVEVTRKAHRVSAQRLLGGLGAVRLTQLRNADIAGYRDAKIGQGYEPSTVAKDIRVLALAWVWGRKHLDIEALRADPPTARVNVPEKLRRSLTPEEVELLLPHVPDDWRRLAVLILFATGCRPGELHQLSVRRTELERGVLVFARGKANPREVPVDASIADAVLAWLDRHPERAHGTVLGVSYDQIAGLARYTLATAAERAGIAPFTAYAFRYGAVNQLIDAGTDAKTEAGLIGHSPETALRYRRRAGPQQLQAAAAKARLGVLPSAAAEADAAKVLPFKR
jgi:integrase